MWYERYKLRWFSQEVMIMLLHLFHDGVAKT
jgi:hypothetical protein